MFTKEDLCQLKEKGIDQKLVEEQLEQFKKGFPFLDINRAATVGDGILKLNETEISEFISAYENILPQSNVLKFVPASGAATRMFKDLYTFMENWSGDEKSYTEFLTNRSFYSMYNFFECLSAFAFYNDLSCHLMEKGESLEKLLETRDFKSILKNLLTEEGLNYGNLPKGLIKFHKYHNFSRRPVGEHMIEGIMYAKNKEGLVDIHFTVSPEHKKVFKEVATKEAKIYEKDFNAKINLSYSEQKSSTDTLAVDLQNKPFRNSDGSLLFRPAGHGALIENLNELEADIIFIKNIDNVVPDHMKEQTIVYKKALAGLLSHFQKIIFEYMEILEKPAKVEAELLQEIKEFIEVDLCVSLPANFDKWGKTEKIDYFKSKLNRPIRVCGMVKNEGEPGGGPFWVNHSDGSASLQIVESSQIDSKNKKQKDLWDKATHFNPVDLVCAVKNYKGKKFNLPDFIDQETGFISVKSKDGKDLKAMELPGLWNGAMANWNTVFVEVPIITFNPVKTIFDLLRKEHQGYI